ncbi:quinone-dependent dihydroorotate dehydrogenase [Tsukamurella sp. 8F]|uniref:quinone-dependent dihydroorotate dehydrogenase n=1 Tax=unclassified Tsukamurella TaxID=2633480 RepID=UPI0023B9B720|nr:MULTISPECIES: quinone-dependent dihydroorotate dehydrogenase [unclassified Tsukamurella]MDF0530514.1 quinone-dependent dihydroorotate dehydrogenase [Tsukamurella sp. 8J]MDF0586836.1 quinone-dependent dihydroorotate dehydrogenase [Tsukamurella sp. 8F]
MYQYLLRILFLVPPERIHHLVFGLIRAVTSVGPLRDVVRRVGAYRDPVLRQTVFGVEFPTPIGLAAGFDKNARAVNAWGAMGFGFAEIGTVTAYPQPGNPAPRMFRLPDDHALINRMGFNNYGAGAAANELRKRAPGSAAVPIGANIGKTKSTPLDEAPEDYRASAMLLGPLADFVVVNVSSPNTPGLRDLQAVESLRPVLAAVLETVTAPVLVKIAPDLSDDDIDAVADLALDMGLAGIVATNTTIARDGLSTDAGVVASYGAGGVSGPPVARRSVQVLRRLAARVGDRLTLISVGGVEDAGDVYERIRAGASLVQVYTRFIYGGPLWVSRVQRELAALLRADGFASVADAVGADLRTR